MATLRCACCVLVLGATCALGAQEPTTWPFEPPSDAFDAAAEVDLRSWNETTAGEHGFIRRSADGAGLVRGDGEPIRFWAVNTSAYRSHPTRGTPDLERHARFLAKRGVNMVRFHGNITIAGDDPDAIDEAERDALWRTVAAMRKAGIYVTFSPYWAVSSHVTPGEHGTLDGGKAKSMGALFFDPALQSAYRNWWRQVLLPENPYTGIPLAKDPALAILHDEYATVLAVSLDGKPLDRAKRILVQVGTTCRPTGWETRPVRIEPESGPARDGERIVSFGTAPWRIAKSQLRITIANPALTTLQVLDANFMSVTTHALQVDGTRRSFAFPVDALYSLLTADPR